VEDYYEHGVGWVLWDILWCCPFYRSNIPDLARSLKDALKSEKFNKIAVAFDRVGDYREFKSG